MCEATVYFEDDEVSNCILTMWTKFFHREDQLILEDIFRKNY